MPKIIQGTFKIIFNKEVVPGFLKMKIRSPEIAKRAQAGQFVHLHCREGLEPLLRRPFSFHRIEKDSFELLYKVVGRGTNILSKKKKGDTIDILGPLGNGFDIKRFTIHVSRFMILVAGGMGVAPLLALAECLVHGPWSMIHGKKKKLSVLIGAKTKKQILCAKDFKKLGAEVFIVTEDGSKGQRGLITGRLKSLLSTIDHRLSTIFACGPNPMLREIACISKRLNISAQGSLEERMACGVGACLGCALKTNNGYKMVCRDGPIFNLREVKF